MRAMSLDPIEAHLPAMITCIESIRGSIREEGF